jgi:hypothetical protein
MSHVHHGKAAHGFGSSSAREPVDAAGKIDCAKNFLRVPSRPCWNHEHLDGLGYPTGALIERRAYKEPMPGKDGPDPARHGRRR